MTAAVPAGLVVAVPAGLAAPPAPAPCRRTTLTADQVLTGADGVHVNDLHFCSIHRPPRRAAKGAGKGGAADDGDEASMTIHLMRTKQDVAIEDVYTAMKQVHVKDPPADELTWYGIVRPYLHIDMSNAVVAYRRDLQEADKRGDVVKCRDAYSGVCTGDREALYELIENRLAEFNAVQTNRDREWRPIVCDKYDDAEGVDGRNFRVKVDVKDLLHLELAGSGSALMAQGTITVALTAKKRSTYDTISALNGLLVRPAFKLKRPKLSFSVNQIDLGSFTVDSAANDDMMPMSKGDARALLSQHGMDPEKASSALVIGAFQRQAGELEAGDLERIQKFISKVSGENDTITLKEPDRNEILTILQNLSNKATVQEVDGASVGGAAPDEDAEGDVSEGAAKRARVG